MLSQMGYNLLCSKTSHSVQQAGHWLTSKLFSAACLRPVTYTKYHDLRNVMRTANSHTGVSTLDWSEISPQYKAESTDSLIELLPLIWIYRWAISPQYKADPAPADSLTELLPLI